MKIVGKKIIAGSFSLVAVTLVAVALADPPLVDPRSGAEQLRKAVANYNARCSDVNAGTPDADWCTNEKARLDAWRQALNQSQNSPGR